jgi:hypothetical protein
MKRAACLAVMMALAAGLCFAQAWNESDILGREIARVSLDGTAAKTVAEKLGDLYIASSFSGTSFRDAAGKFVNTYDTVFIFAAKGKSLVVLGKIDKQTVFGADGKAILDMKKSDPKLFQHVVGVSSSLLRKPLQVVMIEQSIDDPEKYSETAVICSLTIDTAKKTIAIAKGK